MLFSYFFCAPAQGSLAHIAVLLEQLNRPNSYEQLVGICRDALVAIFDELDQIRATELDGHTQAALAKIESDIVRTKYHLKNLDFSLMMIGPMKSGKSTTLESIVGWEIIPKYVLRETHPSPRHM
jgi:hypothetical protein